MHSSFSVKEAVLINQRLESVNEHQNCQLKDYKDELTKVKGELVKVKVKLDCQPQEAVTQQGQDDHDKQTLHQKIKHVGVCLCLSICLSI